LRDQGIFVHEVLLYLDPGRRFSLRLYLHPPGSHTDIHDHSSWGISGCPAGRLSVIRYKVDRRLADDRAVLTQRDPVILSPGEVTVTRAGERGVHQTGSPDANPNVMISVYGRPGRRLYINTYDAQTGRITQRYPPKILRRKLAQQAFRAFYDSDLDA
jgi:predicted metal-dependent enzyme (double-stranded beta helix superfamily)